MINTTGLTGGFDYEHVKEPVYSRSYGKEDTVKETQVGCLSRPIRIKSELFEKFRLLSRLEKMLFCQSAYFASFLAIYSVCLQYQSTK